MGSLAHLIIAEADIETSRLLCVVFNAPSSIDVSNPTRHVDLVSKHVFAGPGSIANEILVRELRVS